MVWLLLLPAFSTHCVCAYLTYTKTMRESALYIPVSMSMTLLSTLIFTAAARQLQDAQEIMFFSFVWDILMLLAFYGVPMLLHKEGIGTQSYMAATIIVFGLIWFKITVRK